MLVALLLVLFQGQGRPVIEKIPVQYAQPADIERMILDPKLHVAGLESLTSYNQNHYLLAIGTPAAVAEIKKRVALLDIQPRTLRIRLTLVDRNQLPDRLERYVIGAPVVEIPNNSEITLTLKDNATGRRYAIELTPRLNGDGSVSFGGELREMNEAGAVRRTGRASRRIPQRETWLLAALLDVELKNVGAGVAPAAVVGDTESAPGVYLEVSAEAVEPHK